MRFEGQIHIRTLRPRRHLLPVLLLLLLLLLLR